ncbi:MAG: 2OG-Fe(II) oxygenase [Nannocystaceae bacterium]
MTIPLRHDFEGGERLCDAPLVHTFRGLLSAEECAHVVAVALPKMRGARVSGAEGVRRSQGRSNDLTWVRHDTDPVIAAIAGRVAALVGLPLAHAESLQVIRYGVGQEYRPHYDAYDLSTPKGQRYTARGGQRLVTTLTYLSEVAAGGETGFPNLAVDVAPERGKMLLFHNCHPGTNVRDPRAYHQGKAVLAGEKWAFNLWFHERSYQG